MSETPRCRVSFIDLGRWAAVSSLFLGSSPTTIAWSVVAVVIRIAVERRSCWPFAHIFKKLLKAIKPLLAHRNTSTTVVVPRMVARVVTTGFSRRPRAILGASGRSSLVSM